MKLGSYENYAGQLNWIYNQTRSDVAYNPREVKVAIKTKNSDIKIWNLEDLEQFSVVLFVFCFFYSSFANLEETIFRGDLLYFCIEMGNNFP